MVVLIKMSVELVMIMLLMTVFKIVQVTGVEQLQYKLIFMIQMVMALALDLHLISVMH